MCENRKRKANKQSLIKRKFTAFILIIKLKALCSFNLFGKLLIPFHD